MDSRANNALQVAKAAAVVYIGLKLVGLVEAVTATDPDASGAPPVGGDPATLTVFDFLSIADKLELALLRGMTEDEAVAIAQLKRAQNLADVQGIVDAFGTRRAAASLYWMTLPAAVSAYMDADERGEVNADYFSKGINYIW